MDRQSSLPSSLIPHLYSAPRNSSTRTTLNDHHRFYPDPPYNFPPLVPPRTSWREGEAGPSSLIDPSPTRLPSHLDRRNTAFDRDSSFADLIRRDQDRDSYFSFSNSQCTFSTNKYPLTCPNFSTSNCILFQPVISSLSAAATTYPFIRRTIFFLRQIRCLFLLSTHGFSQHVSSFLGPRNQSRKP
jgi:hypothetical protein